MYPSWEKHLFSVGPIYQTKRIHLVKKDLSFFVVHLGVRLQIIIFLVTIKVLKGQCNYTMSCTSTDKCEKGRWDGQQRLIIHYPGNADKTRRNFGKEFCYSVHIITPTLISRFVFTKIVSNGIYALICLEIMM